MQRHLDPAARHLGDDVPHDAERDGGAVVVRGGAHPAAHTPRSLCYSQQQCCLSPLTSDSGGWPECDVSGPGVQCRLQTGAVSRNGGIVLSSSFIQLARGGEGG